MKYRRDGMIIFALVCAALAPVHAQVDSGRVHPLFTWRDAVLAGGFAIATVSIRPVDLRAEQALQKPERQKSRAWRKAAVGFRTIAAPGSVIIGITMYATGRLSNNDHLAELGLFGTEALFIGEGAGSVLKDIFGRARPSTDTVPDPDNWQLLRGLRKGGGYQSFPSGHTVAGFAAAAAVTAEMSRW